MKPNQPNPVYLIYVVHLISFQTFLYRHLKLLLLDILGDDWPIFMISG